VIPKGGGVLEQPSDDHKPKGSDLGKAQKGGLNLNTNPIHQSG
jgi:hypothetical protein